MDPLLVIGAWSVVLKILSHERTNGKCILRPWLDYLPCLSARLPADEMKRYEWGWNRQNRIARKERLEGSLDAIETIKNHFVPFIYRHARLVLFLLPLLLVSLLFSGTTTHIVLETFIR